MSSAAPAGDKIHDVFLSYSGCDRDLAEQLDSSLQNAGLRVYFAKRCLLASEDWASAIPEAQRRSLATVVMFRGNNVGHYCKAEIATAIDLRKSNNHIVIPISIDGAPPGFGLGTFSPLAWNAPHDRNLPDLVRKIQQEVGVSANEPIAARDLQDKSAQLLDAILFGSREEIDRCRCNIMSQFKRVLVAQDGADDSEINSSLKDAVEFAEHIIMGICQAKRVASIAGTEFRRLRRTRIYDEVPWGDVEGRHLFHLASATALVASELVSDQRPWSLSDMFIARIIRRVPARIGRLVKSNENECRSIADDADIDDLAGIEDAWPRDVSPFPAALRLLFEFLDKDNHARRDVREKCLEIVRSLDTAGPHTKCSFDLIVAICVVVAACATPKDDNRRLQLLQASQDLLEPVSRGNTDTLRNCLRVLIGRHWYAFALKCQSPTENRKKSTDLWRKNTELSRRHTDLAEIVADEPMDMELRDVYKNMVVSARFNVVLEEFEDAAREATKRFLPREFSCLAWLEKDADDLCRTRNFATRYVERLSREINSVRQLFERCAQARNDMESVDLSIVENLRQSARKLLNVADEVIPDEHLTADFRAMAKDHASHARLILGANSTPTSERAQPSIAHSSGPDLKIITDRVDHYVTAVQSKFWPWENVALDAVVRLFGVPKQLDHA